MRLRRGEHEHRAIVAALAARNAEAAERLVQEHADAAGAALVGQMRAAAAERRDEGRDDAVRRRQEQAGDGNGNSR